jgi:hypothetical protein
LRKVGKLTKQQEEHNMKAITVGKAKDHLENIVREHLPLMMWGPPGIGKSSIVSQICEEKKWKLIDLRLSLLNPVDLRGLPVIDRKEKQAVWMHPEFLPKNGVGILFLDEINKAPGSVMAAAYQLILDRKVGTYTLPAKWRIVAAGNRESDKAQVNRLPSALANRFVHLEVKADVKGWKKWAIKNKIDTRVINFVAFKPDVLATLPQKNEKAYPTPRSWEFVSTILSLYSDAHEARSIIEGAIGEGTASEFFSWLPTYEALPNAKDILSGKSKEVPERPDVMTALSNALVANLSPDNLGNFLNYTMLLKGEFAVLAIKQAVEAGWEEDLQQLDEWHKWVDKHYDLLGNE